MLKSRYRGFAVWTCFYKNRYGASHYFLEDKDAHLAIFSAVMNLIKEKRKCGFEEKIQVYKTTNVLIGLKVKSLIKYIVQGININKKSSFGTKNITCQANQNI